MIRRRFLLRALGAWLLLLGFAVVNGLFRQTVLEPNLGPQPAHILSTATLSVAVFLAAPLLVGQDPRGLSMLELLAIGALWAVLTAGLELIIGLTRGLARRELFRDYDVTRGRLFGLVILAELLSPAAASFLRRRGH